MGEDRRYNAAKARIAELREFWAHLAAYIVVTPILAGANMFLAPEKVWSLFFIGGWGIIMVMHASIVFGAFGLLGKDWEARKMAELMGEKPKRKDGDVFFEESPAD